MGALETSVDRLCEGLLVAGFEEATDDTIMGECGVFRLEDNFG